MDRRDGARDRAPEIAGFAVPQIIFRWPNGFDHPPIVYLNTDTDEQVRAVQRYFEKAGVAGWGFPGGNTEPKLKGACNR